MRITLFEDLHSYIFTTKDSEDPIFEDCQLIGDTMYDKNYKPIGRISTAADLEREAFDYDYEFNS